MIMIRFAFIKPDAVAKRHVQAIIARAQAEGFEVIKREIIKLDMQQAMRFYVQHAGAGFFVDLLNYVTRLVAIYCIRCVDYDL
jgi:nucleoside-diphosphate kinase